MKALITGASSGIGRDMALYLSEKGYDIIVVARDQEKLVEVSMKIKTKVRIIDMDLSTESSCHRLYKLTKNENIDILINNAGFGCHGNFYETDLTNELEMIDLNIKAVHILTKLYLNDFKKRNSGYIMNVASLAAFSSGPLMATYYATKGYVLKLSEAIYEELRRSKSKVHISVLCPGPVDTNFNKVADVSFPTKGLTSEYVAKYAIDKMFKNKLVIIPGMSSRIIRHLDKFVPSKLMLKFIYNIQKRKNR